VGNSLGGIVGMRFLADEWKWRGCKKSVEGLSFWNDIKVDMFLTLGAPIHWYFDLSFNLRLIDPRSVARLASKAKSPPPSFQNLNEFFSTEKERDMLSSDFWKKSGQNLKDLLPSFDVSEENSSYSDREKPNGGWFNLYYPEDVCAGPIKDLSFGLQKSVTEDIAIYGRQSRSEPSGGLFSLLRERIVSPFRPMMGNLTGYYLQDERVWKRVEKLLNENDLI
jgi:hypothetical protein